MRSSALQFLALTIGGAAQYPARPRAPGVAFRLTPDYGVAAIHFKDGTSVPVAQVHGSSEYQAFMRMNQTEASSKASIICRLLLPTLGRLPTAITSNIDICRNANVIHTKALLATLKTVTESYLGTNICYAALSLDDISQFKADVAHEALGALGLHQVLPTVHVPKSFVRAYEHKASPTFDEKPWPVLVIDYSLHWFNVGLYTIGEFGIVDSVEGLVRDPRIDEENQLDGLKDTLNRIFTHPPAEYKLPGELHHLVIYGDDANNHEFRHILKEALLNALSPTQHVHDLLQYANISSSVFNGLAYTAHAAQVHMDTVDFEMQAPSALGCKWRSKLYCGDRVEL